jgi:hypothetical protein
MTQSAEQKNRKSGDLQVMGALGLLPGFPFLVFQLESIGFDRSTAEKIASESHGCESFGELLGVCE